MKRMIEIINKFKGKKIGVIGDLMLDQFIWGDAERISPEAPIPVVLAGKETFIPGGAANVANNIVALKGKVFLVGSVGRDKPARELLRLLEKNKIDTEGVFVLPYKPTTQKIRIIARGQQIVRLDKEKTENIERQTEQKVINFVNSQIKNWDALIISDYGKGFVTENLAKKIINRAQKSQKLVIADTKKPSHVSYFENVTLLTPNSEEALKIAGKENLEKAGKVIRERLKCNVLVTQGAKGMTLFGKEKIKYFSTKAREVFDVAGAGDTVVASLGLALISGAGLEEAAVIANYAAGVVVGKTGVSVVYSEELKESVKNDY